MKWYPYGTSAASHYDKRGTNNTDFSGVLNLIVEIITQIKYNDDGQSNLPMCILLSFVILFIVCFILSYYLLFYLINTCSIHFVRHSPKHLTNISSFLPHSIPMKWIALLTSFYR